MTVMGPSGPVEMELAVLRELRDRLLAENESLKKQLIHVDVELRGAMMWAGVAWGTEQSVIWAVKGAVDRLKQVYP